MVDVLDNNWLLLQLVALGVAGALLSLGGAISARRFFRNGQVRRRVELEAAVKPMLMRALTDDEPDLSCLDVFDARRLEAIIWQLVTKVRGGSRSVLVEWLEARGAIERARRMTRSRSSVRRAVAAEHLGAATLQAAIPELIALLNDREIEVRIVAVRALGKMGDPDITEHLLGTLVAKRSVPAGIVSMALVHTGPQVVDGLIKGIASKHSIVRAVSVELLGLYGALGAGRWLMLALQHDTSNDVRARAAAALGRVGLPQAEDVLQRSTAVGQPLELRVAATTALGRLGSRRSVGVLQILVADEHPEVGAAAAQALVELGEEGLGVLQIISETQAPGARHATYWVARRELTVGARRRRRVAGEVA